MSFKKYNDGVVNSVEETYVCSCGSLEHLIQLKMFDCDPNELYLSVHLVIYNSFFKRIWVSLKYIFGYKCRYGHFDEFIFRKQDVVGLKNFLGYFLDKS